MCSGMPSLRPWTATANAPRGASTPRIEAQDRARFDLGEAAEPRLLRVTLAEEQRTPLPQPGVFADLVSAVRRADEQRERGCSPCDALDHLEREVIDPVQILQHQERRAGPARLAQCVGESEREQVPALPGLAGLVTGM